MSVAPISGVKTTVSEMWIAAGSADRLVHRPIVALQVNGRDLIVLRDSGRLHACERACPHEQADLCLGHAANGRLHCPRHLASFDLDDGKISSGWQSRDLRRYPVRIIDGVIWIDLGTTSD